MKLNNTFKLDSTHASANDENVSFVDGTIGFQEVGLEVNIKQTTSETLHCVINGQNMNSLAILDIRAW